MSFMIMNLRKQPTARGVKYIHGACAVCTQRVYEAEVVLDDAYLVWAGKCPHCASINLLSASGPGRGYSSLGMKLVTPTLEEIHRFPELEAK